MHTIALNGMRVSDRDGRSAYVPPSSIFATTDPANALSEACIVVVTVKSGATRQMGELIRRHVPEGATVVSYQNGVRNAQVLGSLLGSRLRVVAGMVPFNIVQSLDAGDVPHLHRATSGRIHIARGHHLLARDLSTPATPVVMHSDMPSLAWGKLILNLNNALNALSGLPLAQELADRRWRRILAAQAQEALTTLKAHGLRTARVDGVDPRVLPFGLRMPNCAFKIAARSMLAIDPHARSSMWEDLERHRPTEVDYLQGEILALAAKSGTPVPVIQRIFDLIRAAETAREGAPRLTPEAVAGDLLSLN